MMKKDDKKTKDEQPPVVQSPFEVKEHREIHSILHLPSSGNWSKANLCGGVLFIVLAVLLILIAIAEIIVASLGATSERFYEAPQSGRMVAMIVLAVIAVIAIGVAIYAIVGVIKKHTKPLHTTAVVLLVLAVIQALITTVSVHVSGADELIISRSLSESFFRAKDGDLSQKSLWDHTQSGLECCGLYSPEDYRNVYNSANFPPDLPLSCCPSYNAPNASWDKELELCKAQKLHFKTGCKEPVIAIVKGASVMVVTVTIVFIIAELVLVVLGAILSHKRKVEKRELIEITLSASSKDAEIAQPVRK